MEMKTDLATKIKVLIADDHAIVRDGLKSVMDDEPDLIVVGEATNGEEAVRKVEESHPDVVLLDITMPGMDGLEATRRIKDAHPDVRILVLTMHESDNYFFEILEAGASGYFVKGGSVRDLLSALKAVYRGEMYISPAMTSKLLQRRQHQSGAGSENATYDRLTVRERQILRLVAEGKTSQDIAKLLFLSVATIQSHRAHIIAKLGLRNRADMVKYALKRGLIELNS
ncbi:MAG: response regulator transcription factor [Dehalococcoidales bacterium]|nr:response regulator transcription factor [Dehalococcoidales bacterium]